MARIRLSVVYVESVMCPCRSYLREFYFSLGDDGAPDEKQRQLQRLGQLLQALGVDIAAEAAEREAANGAVAESTGEQDQQQKQPKVGVCCAQICQQV